MATCAPRRTHRMVVPCQPIGSWGAPERNGVLHDGGRWRAVWLQSSHPRPAPGKAQERAPGWDGKNSCAGAADGETSFAVLFRVVLHACLLNPPAPSASAGPRPRPTLRSPWTWTGRGGARSTPASVFSTICSPRWRGMGCSTWWCGRRATCISTSTTPPRMSASCSARRCCRRSATSAASGGSAMPSCRWTRRWPRRPLTCPAARFWPGTWPSRATRSATMDTELFEEFFRALAFNGLFTLHVIRKAGQQRPPRGGSQLQGGGARAADGGGTRPARSRECHSLHQGGAVSVWHRAMLRSPARRRCWCARGSSPGARAVRPVLAALSRRLDRRRAGAGGRGGRGGGAGRRCALVLAAGAGLAAGPVRPGSAALVAGAARLCAVPRGRRPAPRTRPWRVCSTSSRNWCGMADRHDACRGDRLRQRQPGLGLARAGAGGGARRALPPRSR